jgi:hypothetical protein
MRTAKCRACQGIRHTSHYLCRTCWGALPRLTRAVLGQQNHPQAFARLRELHRQLDARVPLPDIRIAP